MKRFIINGATVEAERANQGWWYSFVTKKPDPVMREIEIGKKKMFIGFGRSHGHGWAPTLRDIRKHVAALTIT